MLLRRGASEPQRAGRVPRGGCRHAGFDRRDHRRHGDGASPVGDGSTRSSVRDRRVHPARGRGASAREAVRILVQAAPRAASTSPPSHADLRGDPRSRRRARPPRVDVDVGDGGGLRPPDGDVGTDHHAVLDEARAVLGGRHGSPTRRCRSSPTTTRGATRWTGDTVKVTR